MKMKYRILPAVYSVVSLLNFSLL